MSSSNSPTQAKALSDVMVGVRTGDTQREAKGRRDLAEAKIAAYIERNLAVAPPLTNQQIHRLTALLRTSGGAK
ncbi:hypothetical protein HCX50_17045 [Microbacterium oxydans]|uniref:hypothetical protein n=1 Tax=Microbacterium sp. B19(2022) TaxID=2914045 RepID=UPI0014301A77|nr:hypothetical protein [Microbacterium sp. B19(2022)]NJI61135.1 hypothetical protein [Microbacterium sp. B19(2022)]